MSHNHTPRSKTTSKQKAGGLSKRWQLLNNQTIGTNHYWTIALQNADFYADMAPLIRRYVSGRTLDVGAGKLAWRTLLSEQSSSYISGDLTKEHADIDVLFDATAEYPFADRAFDTVFCCSVLEHVMEPWHALSEMWRVLVPGGTLIISVPFVYYLHGQPHDYYRFTRYGVTYLAKQAGFDVERMVANGGLTTLLLNIPSTALSIVLTTIRLGSIIPFATRLFMFLNTKVGKRLEPGGLFTMNHIAVLRKPVIAADKPSARINKDAQA